MTIKPKMLKLASNITRKAFIAKKLIIRNLKNPKARKKLPNIYKKSK